MNKSRTKCSHTRMTFPFKVQGLSYNTVRKRSSALGSSQGRIESSVHCSVCEMKMNIWIVFCFAVLFPVSVNGILFDNIEHSYNVGSDCQDVTIVGAGVSGTFAAWRLRNSGLNIGVFEGSERIGGRMYTRRFQDASDVKIELGAMRFIPSAHPRLTKVVGELGLTVVDFKEGLGLPDRMFYYLRRHHLNYQDLGKKEKLPYFLREQEYLVPKELLWYVSSTATNYTLGSNRQDYFDYDHANFDSVTKKDGIKMYKQSVQEVLEKSISHEAIEYISHVVGFDSSFYGCQSTGSLPPYPPSNNTISVKTIAEGFESVPKGFMSQFLNASSKHTFHPNMRLEKIRQTSGSTYHLTFVATTSVNGKVQDTLQRVTVCTRKVILAIPTHSLQEVDWPAFKQNYPCNLFKSVQEVAASKVVLLYPYAWWLNITSSGLMKTHTRSDLPNHQTYDFGHSQNGKAALLISYTDKLNNVLLWRNMQNVGQCISRDCGRTRVTTEVVRHAQMYLSQIYNVSVANIPPPIDGMMKIWDREHYSPAWTVWKPGVIFSKTMTDIMKPTLDYQVYVLNADFATQKHSAWSEGALDIGDRLLQKYFGMQPYVH